MNRKLENSRKRTAIYKEYFCVITTYKQYQVIRFFMVDCRLKKGSPANYFIIEAVQCWMNKEGKTETLSLLRSMSIFYYDAWIYGSSLELRKRNVHHDCIYNICPAVIYPRMKVIPELTRNGFKGVFYDICPSSFFATLLTDNRMEILYKAGQMNLFLRFLERKYGIDKYWTYVKICLRHDYVIHDADLWLDYVDMLIENKLDARNPHYLCPLNVEEAHDWVMGKCKKKYSEKDEKYVYKRQADKNELRYKGFASAVCKFSGAINAYEHIRVSGDRLAIHEKFDSKSLQKVQVIEFDKDFFRGKKILVFDDILTKGFSYARFACQLEKIGGEVLGGFFLGKTVVRML